MKYLGNIQGNIGQKYRKEKVVTTKNICASAGFQLLNYTINIHNVHINCIHADKQESKSFLP